MTVDDAAKPETTTLVQRSAMNFVGLAAANAMQFALVLMIGRSLNQDAAGIFFEGFAAAARANVHVKVMYGRSNHHKIEAIFKCFARAMRYACSTDERLKGQLPSTKGLL